MGIRNKLLTIIAGALVLSLFINTYFQIHFYNEAFKAELDKRITLLHQNLNQRALVQAQSLGTSVAEKIASFNLFSLSQLLKDEVANANDLYQAVLVSKDGLIVSHSNTPSLNQKPYLSPKRQDISDIQLETPAEINLWRIGETAPSKDQSALLEYQIPIVIGHTKWGDLFLQYSLETLNHAISESIEENALLQEEQTNKSVYLAAVILFVSFVLIAQLSERIVAPIVSLSNYAKEIARHNFTKVFEIQGSGKDEISELSHNFVEMAKNLEESHLEQTNYNLRLEEKVNERTKALNTKNEELVNAFRKVEESQQQLIHSEKMAALGQLVSGIAHEINTPLGAIGASANNTSNALNKHITQLTPILGTSTDPIAIMLNKILFIVSKANEPAYDALSTREERAIKKQLIERLSEFQPEEASQLAEQILDMRLHNKLEELKPEIENPENNNVFALAHSLMSIQHNNNTIHTAIARVSKIVFALKSFSHQDNSGDMIPSDINEGINTVLVLYQNQLKQGCEVHKDLAVLPSTLCYPDELNQVWTNLIHNALQATHNQGKLSITSRLKHNNIVVEINDNGPGIPNEIQGKVFSSFFTTKPAGEGSGLGLGICKKIIDKHQGEISLTSQPGNTTFSVSIPLRS